MKRPAGLSRLYAEGIASMSLESSGADGGAETGGNMADASLCPCVGPASRSRARSPCRSATYLRRSADARSSSTEEDVRDSDGDDDLDDMAAMHRRPRGAGCEDTTSYLGRGNCSRRCRISSDEARMETSEGNRSDGHFRGGAVDGAREAPSVEARERSTPGNALTDCDDASADGGSGPGAEAVSYTHLTLPTINTV